LWIQREIIHNGESQLDALHQIPMKWLLDVQFLDYYGDFRMSLSVYGVHEPFIFRTPDEESCREWVATLKSAREASNSKNEMKAAAFPDLLNEDGSNGTSSDGFVKNHSQHTHTSGDMFPDMDDLKTASAVSSEPPAVSHTKHPNERMTIKELRAIAHGAGYDTRGMERADLEKIAAYSAPASAKGANPRPFNPFESSQPHPSNSTGGAASTQSSDSQRTKTNTQSNSENPATKQEEYDQKIHDESERRKKEEEDRLRKHNEYMQQKQREEAQKAAEAERLKQQQEAQRVAEAQRLKQQQEEAQRAAEAQRLKQQQEEAQRAAEAQRLKQQQQQQEVQRAAEAQRLKQQQEEAQRAAEAQRLRQRQQEEAQRLKQEQESRAKTQQHDPWDNHWNASTSVPGGNSRPQFNGHHTNSNIFESARFGGHTNSATNPPMSAPPFSSQPHPNTNQHFHSKPPHPAPSHPPPVAPPPPPAFNPRASDPTSPMNQKYAKQMAGPGDDHVAIKRNILVHWALVPPQYNMLRPIDQLLVSIHTVFPPFGNVAPHEYFSKWKPIKKEDLVMSAAMGNAIDESKLKKAVRKLRVFLHPDRLPKDFDASQTFVCKMLWDVSNDAEEELLKQRSDLDWIHN
jgi:hypothetical protein